VTTEPKNEFEKAADKEISLLQEFWQFLRCNKKWWLLPIFAILLLIGALIFVSGTAAAPFVYTLF
jgi:hypothetical protein